jgi:hypothetical protein
MKRLRKLKMRRSPRRLIGSRRLKRSLRLKRKRIRKARS